MKGGNSGVDLSTATEKCGCMSVGGSFFLKYSFFDQAQIDMQHGWPEETDFYENKFIPAYYKLIGKKTETSCNISFYTNL